MNKAIFPACVAVILLTVKSAAEVRTGSLPLEVTAAAWAVADGKTGELLQGHCQDEKRFAASTAKLMTTYVVLQMAEADSSVLRENVILSAQAVANLRHAGTLKVGEAVTVDDALHLVMMISDNDLANALAEHFADRLPPPEDDDVPERLRTRANFIAEMNRTARRIGMARTTYQNPFGDGDFGGHVAPTTTAADLVKMRHAILQCPTFIQYISSPVHDIRVRQTDGSYRTVPITSPMVMRQPHDGFQSIKRAPIREREHAFALARFAAIVSF